MPTGIAFPVPPSQSWQGNDGLWSTFQVNIGNEHNLYDVFLSTSQPIVYLIGQTTSACAGLDEADCSDLRGGLYTETPTWRQYGGSSEFFHATNILPNQNITAISGPEVLFGNETVGLSIAGSGLPTLTNNLIGVLTGVEPFLGLLGLFPNTFSLDNQNVPSFFYRLFNNSSTPLSSLSWGYQAGAKYQLGGAGISASLILGGYNSARFVSPGVTFPMNTTAEYYLNVNLQSITIEQSTANGGNTDVLTSGPITVTLDSTLPYLWLPPSACKIFTDVFFLNYNATAEMYFITNTAYATLSTTQPDISFEIGPNADGDTVVITLPFKAWNLTASPPLANNQRYFPLKQATSPDQYMLGRVFFQEAYLFADFNRQTFNVAQADWSSSGSVSITAVYPPESGSSFVPNSSPTAVAQPSSGKSTPVGAIAGGVVGGILVILLIIGGIFFMRRRKRRTHGAAELAADEHETRSAPPPLYDEGVPMAQRSEMDGKAKLPHELNAGRQAVPAGVATPDGAHPYSDTGVLSSGATSPLTEMDAHTYYELPGHRHDHSTENTPLYATHVGGRDSDEAPVVAGSSAAGSSQGTAVETHLRDADDDMSPQSPGPETRDDPRQAAHAHGDSVTQSGFVSPVSAVPRE